MFLFESVRFQRSRLEKRRVYERERERGEAGEKERRSLFSGNVHSNFPRGRVSHVNESCTSSLFIRERHEMCIAFFPGSFWKASAYVACVSSGFLPARKFQVDECVVARLPRSIRSFGKTIRKWMNQTRVRTNSQSSF